MIYLKNLLNEAYISKGFYRDLKSKSKSDRYKFLNQDEKLISTVFPLKTKASISKAIFDINLTLKRYNEDDTNGATEINVVDLESGKIEMKYRRKDNQFKL